MRAARSRRFSGDGVITGSAITTQRFSTLLASRFAALALGLAALGVYGVTGYAVAQRKQEIGTRMSLGASRGAILALILRETALVSGRGIVCGFLIALAFSRFRQGLLYGIGATDVQWLGHRRHLPLARCAGCLFHPRALRDESRSDGRSEIRMREERKMQPQRWIYTIPLRLRSSGKPKRNDVTRGVHFFE